MNVWRIFLIFCLLLMALIPQDGHACSTFCLDQNGQPVFGKNYDWEIDEGLVIVNKRNVSKAARTNDQPASWTSRYGSVTFNQYGREMPSGGMNEAGLVIELMWLDATTYPAPDARSSVEELQWIQYQLDTAATVADVITSDQRIRISSASSAPLHFLVCDSTGACATIEFLDGELVAHTAENLPFNILTNSTYAESMEFLEEHEGFGGILPLPEGMRSLDRFVRIANMMRAYSPYSSGVAVDYAFRMLSGVAQGWFTKWSIVYDLHARRISFRTLRNPQIRSIDLTAFDFACRTPVKILDMNTSVGGDVTNSFINYSQPTNRRLIGLVFSQSAFLSGTPGAMLDALAAYPESMVCNE